MADSGCFSAILRRVLCSGGNQTHPENQITQKNKHVLPTPSLNKGFTAKVQQAPTMAEPGVVAKLMGLDSLPNTQWVSPQRYPDLVTRSKSVNFMDYFLDSDSTTKGIHRRVQSSVSFRENQDSLVLYVGRTEKFESKKLENIASLEKTETRNLSVGKSTLGVKINQRESAVGSKNLKNSNEKRETKKENLSVKKKETEKKQREKSSLTGNNYLDEFPLLDLKAIDRVPKKKREQALNADQIGLVETHKNKGDGFIDNQCRNEHVTRLVNDLCRLTEETIQDSSWIGKNRLEYEDVEEIYVEFGQEIMDQLMDHLVHEIMRCRET